MFLCARESRVKRRLPNVCLQVSYSMTLVGFSCGLDLLFASDLLCDLDIVDSVDCKMSHKRGAPQFCLLTRRA